MADDSFFGALQELAEERGLPVETVVGTVEAALAAAYRKDYGRPGQVIRAELDKEDIAKTKMFQVYEVLDAEAEIEEPDRQLHLTEAKTLDPDAEVGGEVVKPLPTQSSFGRIAAQTAKQV